MVYFIGVILAVIINHYEVYSTDENYVLKNEKGNNSFTLSEFLRNSEGKNSSEIANYGRMYFQHFTEKQLNELKSLNATAYSAIKEFQKNITEFDKNLLNSLKNMDNDEASNEIMNDEKKILNEENINKSRCEKMKKKYSTVGFDAMKNSTKCVDKALKKGMEHFDKITEEVQEISMAPKNMYTEIVEKCRSKENTSTLGFSECIFMKVIDGSLKFDGKILELAKDVGLFVGFLEIQENKLPYCMVKKATKSILQRWKGIGSSTIMCIASQVMSPEEVKKLGDYGNEMYNSSMQSFNNSMWGKLMLDTAWNGKKWLPEGFQKYLDFMM